MCFIFDIFAVVYFREFFYLSFYSFYIVYYFIYIHIYIYVIILYIFRADCCKVDEPGKYPHIGGLSKFGKVSVCPGT